jgi:hypothetical protein
MDRPQHLILRACKHESDGPSNVANDGAVGSLAIEIQEFGVRIEARKAGFDKELAERVGFEPTVGVNLHTLSKRAP